MCGVPRRRRDLGSRPSAQNRRASLARKVLTRTSRLHKLRELSSGQLAPVSLRICGTWLRLTQAEATLLRAMTDEIRPHPEGSTGRRRPPVSVEQAAAYLGRNVRFVRGLVAQRRIEFYKMGRRILISPDELDRYMESCLTPVGGKGRSARNGG